MNLMVKALVIAVVVIALAAIVTSLFSRAQRPMSSAEAISNITNYIGTSYPGAAVNITSVNASQYPGSWHIEASVIVNGTRPCPSYFVLVFDYPKYNFVSNVENNYTADCVVNGVQSGKPYAISSYPIAIAWTYGLHIPQVESFITKYGYQNVSVTASHYITITLGQRNYSNVWLVDYATAHSNNTVEVAINQSNGTEAYVSGIVK
ncbi:MAG: hypothetical protein M1569_01755 [Candidatus Marsarchaeota archaeon]|nr:hypothetical protein [Candidatus Marsarchaeota archaeon]MCL5413106.1 hypothetical protein [Candidatus Marsarchaeota archaeon]